VTDGVHLGCAADLSGFADLAEYTIEYLSSLGQYEFHCWLLKVCFIPSLCNVIMMFTDVLYLTNVAVCMFY